MRIGSRRSLPLAVLLVAMATPGVVTALTVELNLLYVHGVKTCPASRMNAHGSLVSLGAAVDAALPAEIAAFEAAHPGVTIEVNGGFANLYTATPSGIQPSDSPDPLNMDDWEVGDPGCTTTVQGEPCTTAYEWRFRLAAEIDRLFPPPASNIILVGHSTGARTAMEVAANVGPGGVGTHDWGVQDRIAGVMTVHGMLDQIGSSKYNVVGFTSFETACKFSDVFAGFGDSCAAGNGWCEYAGRVDGFPASDWVAQEKRALMLTAWGSCSPSAWTGRSDGLLPYDAQGSPWAVGLDMTPAPGQTWRPSHGELYGSFCHSAITNTGHSQHAASRAAATQRLLDWLFVAAPRVAAAGSDSTPSIGFNQFSATFAMGSTCPAGEVDDTITSGTKGPGIDVVGVCRHPGFFDGDDHPIAMSELFVTNGPTCNGAYQWQQAHDPSNNHAANFWWKTRSLHTDGPDLMSHLTASALALCGNGVLDPGEACDDGNQVAGDCCSPTCEPEPAGQSCADDGNPCTDDACDGAGTCAHVPNSAPCDDGLFCNGADTCSGGTCSLHAGDPCAGGDECNDTCDETTNSCATPAGTPCSSDGNPCTDDACDGAGACAHVPNSAPCDDGSACTVGDVCAAGACAPGPAADCGRCGGCDADLGCIVLPRSGCKTTGAGDTLLLIRDAAGDRRDTLIWRWRKGEATAMSELGDPVSNDDYTLCIYDESGSDPQIAFEAGIPGGELCSGRPCWRSSRRALRYKDRARTPDGVDTLRLLTGDVGRSGVLFKGKGENLTSRPAGLPSLPLALPLRVQLRSDAGTCWEATYEAARVNQSSRFKALSD